MTDYTPPLREIRFALDTLAGLPEIAALPGYEEATPDLTESILEEAARIASGVLAPLNRAGDLDGAKLTGEGVRTTPGWREAWATLIEGGWNALPYPAEFGGMALPGVLNLAVQEMWQTANMAFALCPMLTQGAANAIALYGSDDQKARFLPRMVTGEWTGTMNLTEPLAGSDLAAVRTRAVPEGGAYRITGQKIFITYGDHDLTENIVHLVLARLPDAPAGVKGISLFIVPKVLPDGAPNDVSCVSLEHKLGIHGSPTAVLAFGEKGGALGELVGEPNRGLEYMFSMMNHARLNVGLQGLAIAERSYQQARAYARGRQQGRPVGWQGGPVGIVEHADVRRMLMSMKARIEAMRGLLYRVAADSDVAHRHPDPATRAEAQRRVDLLTPVAKGWCTETGIEIASLGVQVHGGMGYIEETGAAQHWRDARITTIYEGTTAIQANALVGRGVLRDEGAAAGALIAEIAAEGRALAGGPLAAEGAALAEAADTAARAVVALLAASEEEPRRAFAAAVPFLTMLGTLAGAQMLLRAAAAALAETGRGDADPWWSARVGLARFYAAHVLPRVGAELAATREGAGAVFAFDEELL
ncbi:acyl-CoA dehydrogenase [Amaricoccus solimangrovi]|uniref:Acyl-CoA dehydrogenase n=1 Tax=Amaricoccus solimangrovi TaxID=2589815 RepID=A0A501WZC4_9RHOB|nr:acyl-CoA dehydrogenase [Amaricoccus solimangrovi]TPE53715.1 acyl-CoA dehydrogenase [Amaricoccus solimangrovi]